MSCLLPQFRCSPDAFVANLKSHQQSAGHISKSKAHICVRPQCVLSTTSTVGRSTVLEVEKLQLSSLEANSSSVSDVAWKPSQCPTMAPVLDMEKLELLSLEPHSNSSTANRSWTHAGPVDSTIKANLGAALVTESLIANEEAVIAAAAAEAVALAKAALKVAKDAATMISGGDFTELDNRAVNTLLEANSLLSSSAQLDRLDKSVIVENETVDAETGMDKQSFWFPFTETGDVEPSHEELEVLDKQLLNDVAVRSKRQKERKAKRDRAAERASANVVSLKSGPTGKKKRPALQDVDYSDPLRYLRGTTTASRLLTASEEQVLSEGIQDLLKLERLQQELTQRCGAQPSFTQWATAAGIDQRTLRKRINYGIMCKDKMIKSNIRLVISIAKKYQGSGMNLQDLVQEGCRGLVRGAEKFDASKGFKFSTYAHWWIKQAIRKSLSDQSRTIRLPFHMVEATYRVKEAKKQLFSEHGRQPDDEEVAQATGLSMKRLSTVMLTPKAPRSLDQKIGMNQNLKPSEVIADPEAESAEELLMKQFMKQDLEKVLDTLNPREKKVIRWRFGLDDGRMKTLQEIGELMGVSRERIRQMESSAFRKLKNKRRTKHLQQYLLP
ncbi:OLC1v1001764C2 [Oldenlandia corymbosa var. corymbosa]|uniref:RNA polymerase sigma factor n=1 Tax=Oldenlandia corymbosa var. corymbosa TaxID=529605 RepID=A0AAV1D8C4_OLDCO|nr:OLC1v1001764C2 [Oldenlandia corymbosa var. corymbosa]